MENLKIPYKELLRLKSLYDLLLEKNTITEMCFTIIEPNQKLLNPTLFPISKQSIPDQLILRKHYQHFRIFHSFNKDFAITSIAIDNILKELPQKFDGMKRLYQQSGKILKRNLLLDYVGIEISYYFDADAQDFSFEFIAQK